MTGEPEVVLGAYAPGPVHVGPAGELRAPSMGWTLRWTVRADDRWRDPATEVTVRRRGIAAGAGTEVALRVPSGDALARCWVVPHGAGSMAVLEFENDSPVPFVVAVELSAPGHTLELDGTQCLLDGRPALWSARTPREAEVGGVETQGGGVRLAWPVPHRTTLRLLVPAHPDTAVTPPAVVPGADQAGAGWATITDQGARLSLPEPGLDELYRAAVRRALVAAADPADRSVEHRARLAAGLVAAGHADAALRLLGEAFDGVAPDGTVPGEGVAAAAALLIASGQVVELVADTALAEALADRVAAVAEWLVAVAVARRWRRRRVLHGSELGLVVSGLMGAAAVLDAAGEPESAAAAREATTRLGLPGGAAPVDPPAPAELVRRHWVEGLLLEPPDGGDGGVVAAELVGGLVQGCVQQLDAGLELLSTLPPHWLGAPVEVYGVPTRHGRMSFAVRWHGERPALLWELERGDRRPDAEIELRVPGLDPSWVDTRERAEALLGVVDGVRLEAQPLRRGDETPGAPEVPGEGRSFS